MSSPCCAINSEQWRGGVYLLEDGTRKTRREKHLGWTQNALITIDPDTRAVTYNPSSILMKHFAHFVEPGAVRLGL